MFGGTDQAGGNRNRNIPWLFWMQNCSKFQCRRDACFRALPCSMLHKTVCLYVQIHEEAQRKAEAEAAAVLEERHRASEEAARMAAAAKQQAHSMHQIQAQQESEAKKKCALLSKHFILILTIHSNQTLDVNLESTASRCTHLHLPFSLSCCCHFHLLCSPSLRCMMCIGFMLSSIILSASKVQHVARFSLCPLQKLQSIATDHLLP